MIASPWPEILLSYGHFTAAFILVGALVAEVFVLRLPMRAETIRLIGRIDLFYGIAAGLLLTFGVMRLFWGGKGIEFYLAQPFFYAKMVIFLLAGLLSIPGTLAFLRWRKSLSADAGFAPNPDDVRRCHRLALIQVHVIALIPLFAALMAWDARF